MGGPASCFDIVPQLSSTTCFSRADALAEGSDGKTYFVEPHTQQMTMTDFLDTLSNDDSSEVYYLQSQNGNLFTDASFHGTDSEDISEFGPLQTNIPKEIPWASGAIGENPPASLLAAWFPTTLHAQEGTQTPLICG
jgi:peptidyl-lysine (3S)-dioxygenase / protease